MPIKVTTDIPFGNAADVVVTEPKGLAEVSFTADPHGGPEALWFCFRVETGRAKTRPRLRLVLRNSENMLGCGRPRFLRPVVRAEGGDWERLGAGEVTELADGRALVAWTLDAPRGYLDVAMCYPYGRDEVDALLRETKGFYSADVIGVSQGGRPMVRLSNLVGPRGSDRPGLYLIARQHSGETAGGWALDGFLREIASMGESAPLVWAVPLSNIDGVEQGDYGKDNFPWDLNRAWGSPPMRHETLILQRDVNRWKGRCRATLGIDFHSPGGTETVGVYAFVPNPGGPGDMHRTAVAWSAAARQALGNDFAAEDFDRVATYASRWETPNFTNYFCEAVGVCGMSFEVSYALAGERVLTREDYREIGERIARGVVGRLRC